MERFHFGLIGLKIGDEITFKKNARKFIVSSGNGTPDNGGTLVCDPENYNDGSYSLRYITRRLLGNEFDESIDIPSMWEYQGCILREMYDKSIG